MQRCLNGCLSFYGQQLGIGYSLLIIQLKEVSPWLIGVVYVLVMSVDHLLLHCKFSHALWSAIFEVFRIHWVMWKTVSALLFAWRNWFGKH